MRSLARGLHLWLLGGASPRVRLHILCLSWFRDHQHPALARYVEARLQRKYGVFISHKARFPASLVLKHPVGVVIGEGVTLGERVTLFQHVTLGGARIGDARDGKYPRVGDDTLIFAGAVIIGDVRIGKNAVVGANSVVLRDVPDHAIVAGAPARVIGENAAGPSQTEQSW